jgi:hypothetical protein
MLTVATLRITATHLEARSSGHRRVLGTRPAGICYPELRSSAQVTSSSPIDCWRAPSRITPSIRIACFATGCSAGGLFSGAMATARSNYMAAVASNSGGWTTPVMFQNMYTPALMTVHGAPGTDVVIVDFSETSATADMAFKQRGGFVINCNHGGGHCGGADLAPDIWAFFEAHPYGVTPEPWAGGLPADFSPQCMIY